MIFDLNRPPVRLPLTRTPVFTPIISTVLLDPEDKPRAAPPAAEQAVCEGCRELAEANRRLQLEVELERAKNSKFEKDAAWRAVCRGATPVHLEELSPSELSELRQLKRPPVAVKQVVDALCLLLGVTSDRVLLSDPMLTAKLRSFDSSVVADDVLRKVQVLIDSLSYDRVAASSKPAAALFKWLQTVVQPQTETTPRRLLMLASSIHQP